MFKNIVKSIIPDNIKEIKLIQEAIDIFISEIMEKSNLALDVFHLYSDKNEVMFEEVIKVFVKNIYDTITKNINNEILIKRLDELYQKAGYKNFRDIKINNNILNILTKETVESIKLFQQTKGHKFGIEFIYRLVEDMNWQQGIVESDGYFNFYEGNNEFEYYVEGSLIAELFEYFVKPLAHPVGWAYIYLRVINLHFTDYFLSKPVITIKEFEVGCQKGLDKRKDDYKNNIGYLPETDKNDEQIEQKFYLADGNIKSSITRHGQFFENLDLPSELKLVLNNKVKNIEELTFGKSHNISIYFESGELLEFKSNPRSLILYYFESENPLNAKIKKNYNNYLGHCGLNLKYDRKVVTTLKDKIQFAIDFGLSNTVGFLNVLGAGNNFLNGKISLGQKYLERVPLTYKSKVKNDFINSSNYKNLYPYNFSELHRTIEKFYCTNNSILIHVNTETFEDDKKPYKIILNDNIKECEKINEFDGNFKNKICEVKIIDKFENDHEYIKFKFNPIKRKRKQKFIPEYEIFEFKNSYYYNNIAGTLSSNDNDISLYNNKVVGNSGLLCYDTFDFIINLEAADITLEFSDKFKMPYDLMDEPNSRWYQTLWGMTSGHVDNYFVPLQPIGFFETFNIKDDLKIEVI